MYVLIILLRMQVAGFIIGYASRFGVELMCELVCLQKYFPKEAKFVPGFKEIQKGLCENLKFVSVFVFGYSAEILTFEIVPLLLYQIKDPLKYIALWMSNSQLIYLSTSLFLRGLGFSCMFDHLIE